MPDMIPAVGADINPPNPGQGLGMLSGLIGLKQQQAQLQTEQSGAQQAQEQMKERQIWQQTMQSGKDPDGNSIYQDGTTEPDPDKLISVAQRLPLIGQGIAQSVIKTKSDKVGLTNSVRELGQNYRNDLAGIVSSNIGGSADSKQIKDQLWQYSRQNPDATDSATYASNLLDHLDNAKTQDERDSTLRHIQMEFQPASATAEATALQRATETTGAALVPGVVRPAVSKGGFIPGAGSLDPNAPGNIPSKLPPQVIYQPITGAPAQVGGAAGTTPVPIQNGPPAASNAPPGAQPPNPWQPTPGYALTVQGDNDRYNQISNTAQMAQTGQNLARNVALLAKGVQTGKFSQDVTDWLSIIRQQDPKLSDRQLLSKYAAQLQNTAIGAVGADTDLGRGVVLHGMPNPDTMAPPAIEDASRYVQGLFGMASARGQVASNYVRATGGSAAGLRANVDDNFMRNANPDVFTARQIPAGKERQDWLKSHGYGDPDAKARLIQQSKLMDQYGIQ